VRIVVEAPARLHMGFYNFLTDNVAYGSIGLTLEEPKVVITVRRSQEFKVINKSNVYVDDVIENVTNKLGVSSVEVRIERAIPRHVGLGSTTQLSLALGTAIMRVIDRRVNVRELAVALGRGRDSGIGIAAFQYGGFIMDSGRRVHSGTVEVPKSINDLPHPIFRARLPRDWYFIIAIPRNRVGLDEKAERRAMDAPQSIPKDMQYELYKLLILKLMPSLIEKDIKLFSEAITKIQTLVGTYFSRYQGGVFCCEETEFIINSLLKHGAYGAGQSSWGPTTYGIVKGYRKAVKVLSMVKKDSEERGYEIDMFITRGRNKGALISNVQFA